MEGQWCTIESDPCVFRELADKLGVLDVQFEEVIDLDAAPDSLSQYIGQVYGFVFLFKWTGTSHRQQAASSTGSSDLHPLIFIKQNVTNSCATISVLHLAFNQPGVQLSRPLSSFRDFIADLPPEMRGLALTNSHEIRTAHNSFITFESIAADPGDTQDGSVSGDAFHFVTIMEKNGNIYILDGIHDRPVLLGGGGSSPTRTIIEHVKQIVTERGRSGEIRFSLLAMIPDQAKKLEEQLASTTDASTRAKLQQQIAAEKERKKRPADRPASSNLSAGDRQNLDLALDLFTSSLKRALKRTL